ncbi:MAG: hypothetical protein GF330_03090 [Candidatus Eisenbacteria bacterium]|nr:hypothetical protein [Candidatus Eisenbacteria bacterium]
MRISLLIIPGLLWAGGGPATARAQVRAAGMAGAYTAVAAGAQAASWNPANLALYPDRGIELFSLTGAVGNDSYSLSDYRRFNGAYWGESEKQEILSRIESETIGVDLAADVTAAGLALGGWAFSTTSHATSRLALPKEYLRLVLYGNAVGETFRLDGAAGDAVAYSEFRFSAAQRLAALVPAARSLPGAWSAGVSLKLLQGWAYGEIQEASGGVTTTTDAINGAGELRSLLAQGGSGYALDLGLAGALGGGWTAGFAARDIAATIHWDRGVEERIDSFVVDGLTLDEISDETVRDESVTISRPQARLRLPVTYALGVARHAGRLLAAASLEIGSHDGWGARRSPRFSAGLEWTPWGFLALRTGLALGGLDESSAAVGSGFAVGRVRIDLAIQSWGTLNLFDSRGLGGGLGIGIVL